MPAEPSNQPNQMQIWSQCVRMGAMDGTVYPECSRVCAKRKSRSSSVQRSGLEKKIWLCEGWKGRTAAEAPPRSPARKNERIR